MTDVRVSRVNGEVLIEPSPEIRLTRTSLETLLQPAPDIRLSRILTEVLFLTSDPAGYELRVKQDDPIVYYRMGETDNLIGPAMLDSSDIHLNGVYNNSPILGVTGLQTTDSDYAVRFDRTVSPAQSAQVGDNAVLRPTLISVEVAVKPTTVANQGYIVSKANVVNSFGSQWSWALIMLAGGGVAAYAFTNLDSTGINVSVSNVLQAGVVTNLAMTYDGVILVLYADGLAIGSVALTGTLNPAANVDIMIGTANWNNSPLDGTNSKFDGVVDEVAIFGTALSAESLADHYAVGFASGPEVNYLSGEWILA